MITVVLPTISGREEVLVRALRSVEAQTLQAAEIIVELDTERTGAAATRNRALAKVTTDWVAFLDDDDELLPDHLRLCSRHAWFAKADVVYPGYETVGEDPVDCFGVAFNGPLLRQRNYIPVTTLCRIEMVLKVGGFQPHPDEHGDPCEDWGLWLALLDAGAKFSHLACKTWIWRVDGGTRGRGVER